MVTVNIFEAKTHLSRPVEQAAGGEALVVDGLPDGHRDPFDRVLLAQALSEGIPLVTGDALLAKYPGPIRKV